MCSWPWSSCREAARQRTSQGKDIPNSRTVFPGLGDRRRGRLSLEETAFYVAELIEAVSEVHRYGHVHRDLKPEPWL